MIPAVLTFVVEKLFTCSKTKSTLDRFTLTPQHMSPVTSQKISFEGISSTLQCLLMRTVSAFIKMIAICTYRPGIMVQGYNSHLCLMFMKRMLITMYVEDIVQHVLQPLKIVAGVALFCCSPMMLLSMHRKMLDNFLGHDDNQTCSTLNMFRMMPKLFSQPTYCNYVKGTKI